MQTKPLYQAQKFIQHQKHIKRLQQIANKKLSHNGSRNTIDEMHRIRHQSSDFYLKEKNQSLNIENTKILNKLLEISQRKQLPTYSTIGAHCVPKKPKSIIIFDNPERKRRQQQILQTNNKLAKRLLTKQSQFDRTKVTKGVAEYENLKKLMQNNRRIKLVPMARQDGNGYEFSRITTTHNSRMNTKSPEKSTNEISLNQTSI